MTAIPSFAIPDMDASHLDDKMDVASSPFRQIDDIDIELDSVREPSVMGSVHDEMIDDTVIPADAASDVMQDQFDEALPDDDMFDDSREDPREQQDTDYNMDGPIDEAQRDEDEDILYEDEDEDRPGPPQDDGIVEYNSNQTSQGYLEAAAEVVLEDLDNQPETAEQHNFATNESENVPVSGTVTGDQLAENLDQDQSLNDSGEYLGETQEEPHPQHDAPPQNPEEPEQVEPADQQTEHQDSLDGPQQPQATIEADESLVPADVEELGQVSTTSNGDVNLPKAIHPVTLYYLEEEMSLFPPMLGDASSVYFLSDSSLAFEPLDKLLAACRDILVGTLDHHDELVLDVPGLGLHICEDSKYAAEITLAQIVDVYLRLCHNDQGQVAQPLYCHLSSRVSLASQYRYLAAASGEGKTYAEIAADHLDSPELEGEDTAAPDQQEAQDGNHSSADTEPPAAGEPADNAEDNENPDVFDLEDQTQNNATARVTGTAVDIPPPDADNSETLAGTESSEQLNLHEEDYPQDGEQESGYDEVQIPESAGDGLHQGTGDTGRSYEDHEDETDSSHTVEGDLAETSLQAASAGSDQSNEQGDDIFRTDDGFVEPGSGYEPFDDEELFPVPHGDPKPREQEVTTDIPAEDQSSTSQDLAAQDLSHDVTSSASVDELHGQEKPQSASAAEIPAPGNPSSPITPRQAKRKAEDADEFLFLDFDTPDPKRQRSL
ncbi:hypothetical protein PV04_02692 [Phialophora macrospora]|uniref:Uncharacterized protein n=1 Tax=Phialophora macrospora TaxID=1851006 RepID=A0A0D2E7Y5_9EURO|nr:hypothetical protein PV04_02692 [Phialophora macrospora]